MSLATICRTLSLQEYLAREEVAEDKHEYRDGIVLEMPVKSTRHCVISGNILGNLCQALRRTDWQPWISGQRYAMDAKRVHTYADVGVSPREYCVHAFDPGAITNPHTLFEVLSPTTESYNRGLKFEFYRSLPSLQEYILVAQNRPAVDRFVRQANGQWLLFDYHGLDATIPLPGIGCELRLADIYEGVEFGEEEKISGGDEN
ncbi:MAG: Uma2 family endonuclease [Pirellulaceae bacterium]